MNIITYNIQLDMNQKSVDFWTGFLSQAQSAFNDCAKIVVDNNVPTDIKAVHHACYDIIRKKYPIIPAQAVIRMQKEVLAAVRSIKANKHKDAETPQRHTLSMTLDKRLYARLDKNGIDLTGEVKNKRTHHNFILYPKAVEMFENYFTKDPVIFVRNNKVWLSVRFEVPVKPLKDETSIGVDLGVKRLFVTSEGKAFKDTTYLKKRREIRYLKRKLKSKNTKSSLRHLKSVRRREHCLSNNMCHRAANVLLNSTDASIIVMEDLTKLKKNTRKTKNGFKRTKHNNMLSQVPFYRFKEILTYKAQPRGKRVETVSPTYTSQTDSRTNKRNGKRLACRYICVDGKVFDADWNASVNIAVRGKHPFSKYTPYDGGITFLNGRVSSTTRTFVNRKV